MFFRGKSGGRVQHIDEVATRKGRGAVTANQVNFDELMVARKRDFGVTRIEQMEASDGCRRIRNERCSTI